VRNHTGNRPAGADPRPRDAAGGLQGGDGQTGLGRAGRGSRIVVFCYRSVVSRIPAGPAEVTPEWLTRVLRARAVLHRSSVASIRTDHIGTFSSELYRLTVDYDEAEDKAEAERPRTLVLKCPKQAFELQAALFAAEIEFYEKLAGSVPMRVPRFYFGAIDHDARSAMLLLEDVPGLLAFRWDASDEHLRLAREAMARLHAQYWGRVEGLALPDNTGREEREELADRYERGWSACRDFVLRDVEPRFEEIGARLVGRVSPTLAPGSTSATLLHGDAHGENIPLVSEAHGGGVHFLDWAGARRGVASFDLAVFLSMSLPVSRRREVERGFVAEHAAAGRAAGVTGWSDPWHDYRRGVLQRAIAIIAIASHMPIATMAAGFSFVVVRSIKAAVDLDVGPLISGD